MKRKNFTLVHFAMLLAVSVAVFSCKKDDVEGNSVSLTDYLPTSIAQDGEPMDSLQYNSDYRVTKLLYNTGDDTWNNYYSFRYDSKKNLTGFTLYYYNEIDRLDTIVYKDGKILDIQVRADGNQIFYDTTVFSVDGSNRITLIGSKDTIRYSNYKELDYTSYSFSGENLDKYAYRYYYYRNENDKNDFTYFINYEYGNKLNPFYYVFAKCPALAMILHYNDELEMLPLGKNNITKFTHGYVSNGNTEQSVVTINNYYQAGSDFFNKQEITEAGNTRVYTYNLKKIK